MESRLLYACRAHKSRRKRGPGVAHAPRKLLQVRSLEHLEVRHEVPCDGLVLNTTRDDVLPELKVQSGMDSDTGPCGSGDLRTDYSSSITDYESEFELFHNAPSVCQS